MTKRTLEAEKMPHTHLRQPYSPPQLSSLETTEIANGTDTQLQEYNSGGNAANGFVAAS
jgi:hypothetical protein